MIEVLGHQKAKELYLARCLPMVESNSHFLSSIPDSELYIELVKVALRRNGLLLQYIKPQYKKNTEIVLIAVQQNNLARYYADPEIVQTNIEQSAFARQVRVIEAITNTVKSFFGGFLSEGFGPVTHV